jgi:hypothetical protein
MFAGDLMYLGAIEFDVLLLINYPWNGTALCAPEP